MIFSRRRTLAILLLASPALLSGAAARKAPTRPAEPADSAAYKGAIVVDVGTGNVLFEDRADFIGPPASVTKLMTFLIVHDRIARGDLTLQTPVTVTAEAAKTGGSQVYLAEKEVFPVEELLYALMIASANDAATALAIHCAGSKSAFVELMNARAQELGMTKTMFRSPHGLPPVGRKIADSDLTTPRDLATLSVHLLKKTNILTYCSVKQRIFRPGPKQQEMINHNKLLGKVAGVDGLKTGFTQGAGFCLAATALRNGRRVLAVTMGSPDSKTRDLKIAELLERGFAKLPPALAAPAVAADAPIKPAPTRAAPATTTATPSPGAPAAAAANSGDAPVRFVIPKR